MRNKARLSVTGSTGENGRVMTPEFPKAVHAVPYARPDMGLNVSLTDLSWSMKHSWVPYNGSDRAIRFFLPSSVPALFFVLFSGEKVTTKKNKGDGGFIFFVKTLYYSSTSPFITAYKHRETENKKGGSCFSGFFFFFFLNKKLVTPCFPICSDWTETEARAWLTAAVSSGSQRFSHLRCVFMGKRTRVCECVCVRPCARRQQHTVSVATTAKQDFQAHLISSQMWNAQSNLFFCLFF